MSVCDNPLECPYILSCTAHQEHLRRDIESIKNETHDQWIKMEKIKTEIERRQDKLLTRLNVLLGGIAVACIMLAINLLVK
jgi:cell division protein FtsL